MKRSKTYSLSFLFSLTLAGASLALAGAAKAAQPMPAGDDLSTAQYGVVPYAPPLKLQNKAKPARKKRAPAATGTNEHPHTAQFYREEPSDTAPVPEATYTSIVGSEDEASGMTPIRSPKATAPARAMTKPKAQAKAEAWAKAEAPADPVAQDAPARPAAKPKARVAVRTADQEDSLAPDLLPTRTRNAAPTSVHVVTTDAPTLSEVAVYLYGHAREFRQLAEWNGISAPYVIRLNQKLKLFKSPTVDPKDGIARLQAMRDRRHSHLAEARPAAHPKAQHVAARPATTQPSHKRPKSFTPEGDRIITVTDDMRSLGDVAIYYFGSARHVRKIGEWNDLHSPYVIHRGQKLILKEAPTLTAKEGSEQLLALWRKRLDRKSPRQTRFAQMAPPSIKHASAHVEGAKAATPAHEDKPATPVAHEQAPAKPAATAPAATATRPASVRLPAAAPTAKRSPSSDDAATAPAADQANWPQPRKGSLERLNGGDSGRARWTTSWF